MNRSIRTLMFLALLTTPLLAQQGFSANIVGLQAGTSSTVYATRGKLRLEGAGVGHAGAIIVNLAQGTTDVLIPERKMYMEITQDRGPGSQRSWAYFRPSDVEDACAAWRKLPSEHMGECHKVGHETINGRSTVKYEGKTESGELHTVWIDSKIAFPIKWEGKNSHGELQNIKEGEQPASLFEIPSDYQKMQLPAGMPGPPQR